MAAIHKGKKKGQVSMKDANFRKPESTGKFYMNANPIPDIQANALLKKKKEENDEQVRNAMEDRVKDVKFYNETLKDVSNDYKDFSPYNEVLIRLFLREPTLTESGIYLGNESKADYVELQRRGASGDRHTSNTVITPFKFDTKAVIVSVPKFLEEDDRYEVGKVVCVHHLSTKGVVYADNTTSMSYEYAFVHPSYGNITPPTSSSSAHFGYALVPAQIIRGGL